MLYLDRNNLPPSWAELEETFREEGRKVGKEEGQRTVAKRMLKAGLSIEVIARLTELPEEEIRNL